MDVRTVKDLCQRLDELGTILELMEGEPVNVALHREASDVLNQALSEIERLRSEADLHRETSHALRDALVEIERLQSEAADLQHTKFDGGLSNLSPTLSASATDWFKYSPAKSKARKATPISVESRDRQNPPEGLINGRCRSRGRAR